MSECLRLKKSNCKNCYKCIRHCPVKSIRFSGNQANIVSDECILCGQCFVVCPQNAKEIIDDTEKAKVLIGGENPVIASIAPSFIANYNVGISSLKKALKKLGFFDAEETSVGATIVKKQYEKMIAENNKNIIISSCCHTVNLLIQKYFPSCLEYLADVMSPMMAHCTDIKKRYPNAKTVFIGPCVSKKDEASMYSGTVDCVLTFEELTKWFEAENITLENETDSEKNSRARLFPTTGGILKTMDKPANSDYTYIAVDGTENCIAALKDIQDGNISKCFIEMSSCTGSCIGGPVMEKFHRSPVRDFRAVSDYAGSDDFVVNDKLDISRTYSRIPLDKPVPSESQIKTILNQMGKTRPEHELNCGSCGYNTCREKAVAVYQGKADLSMCLPFLKDRAENFSDNIINNTPNAIIVLNESLEVQQINKAALSLMNIRNASDVLGEQVIRILDPKDFMDVKLSGSSIRDKHVYLAEYNKYAEETIIYDREYHVLMCIMRDITAEETQKERKEQISRQTIDVTDKVIDKQMRVVQEIASLLGETVAETKVALTKLKESLKDE